MVFFPPCFFCFSIFFSSSPPCIRVVIVDESHSGSNRSAHTSWTAHTYAEPRLSGLWLLPSPRHFHPFCGGRRRHRVFFSVFISQPVTTSILGIHPVDLWVRRVDVCLFLSLSPCFTKKQTEKRLVKKGAAPRISERKCESCSVPYVDRVRAKYFVYL